MSVLITDEEEDRCELLVDEDSRCPNRATRIVRECFTPAAIKQRVCADCAKDQIDAGYIDEGAL